MLKQKLTLPFVSPSMSPQGLTRKMLNLSGLQVALVRISHFHMPQHSMCTEGRRCLGCSHSPQCTSCCLKQVPETMQRMPPRARDCCCCCFLAVVMASWMGKAKGFLMQRSCRLARRRKAMSAMMRRRTWCCLSWLLPSARPTAATLKSRKAYLMISFPQSPLLITLVQASCLPDCRT